MRSGRRSRIRSREWSSAYLFASLGRQARFVTDENHQTHSESQRALLQNALAVANRVPANNFVGGAANVEEAAWKNCWNWCVSYPPLSSVGSFDCARAESSHGGTRNRNLPDAQYGNLIFDVRDGRMGSEMKSQGESLFWRARLVHVRRIL